MLLNDSDTLKKGSGLRTWAEMFLSRNHHHPYKEFVHAPVVVMVFKSILPGTEYLRCIG